MKVQFSEIRPVNTIDIEDYKELGKVIKDDFSNEYVELSISEFDLKNGSPKIGDMIARNPNNHNDQWLISEKYYRENYLADKKAMKIAELKNNIKKICPSFNDISLDEIEFCTTIYTSAFTYEIATYCLSFDEILKIAEEIKKFQNETV